LKAGTRASKILGESLTTLPLADNASERANGENEHHENPFHSFTPNSAISTKCRFCGQNSREDSVGQFDSRVERCFDRLSMKD
jgi:hypothetical protein